MRHLFPVVASAVFATLLWPAVPVVGGQRSEHNPHWAQWRGPDGQGIATGTYQDTWSDTEHVAWKTEIPGRGHSSPIVWGNRIFLTTSLEGKHVPGRTAPDHLGFDMRPGYLNPDSTAVDYDYALQVLAVDATTGKILWRDTSYDGPMYDNRHRMNTYASASVVTDGTMVYASFEAHGFYAYTVDGELKWQVDLGHVAKAGLGPGTSPVLYKSLVILQVDQEMGAESRIIAFDRQTGAEVWRAERNNRRSWATPVLVSSGSGASARVDLVASGAEAVVAYDPDTGRERWRTEGTRSHPIPSFVQSHGLVFASAGNGAKVLLALRPDATDDASRIAWRYNKGTAYVTSPIAVGHYLYVFSDSGITTCLDARTGEIVYVGGRVPVPATFRASAVSFDDKILMTSEDGDTFVLRAGPTHDILRTNSLNEPIWASPALANGTIYIRGEKHLFAIK
ncbi:MAG: PQQ-like beta-propeller repeat protein [Acidobacteria bacterium]|nr:PQQ-like beta-propeller repeat protein [Acidobacteriota bacterium]